MICVLQTLFLLLLMNCDQWMLCQWSLLPWNQQDFADDLVCRSIIIEPETWLSPPPTQSLPSSASFPLLLCVLVLSHTHTHKHTRKHAWIFTHPHTHTHTHTNCYTFPHTVSYTLYLRTPHRKPETQTHSPIPFCRTLRSSEPRAAMGGVGVLRTVSLLAMLVSCLGLVPSLFVLGLKHSAPQYSLFNSFGWEYKPRSSLCTHAFHLTDSKDPDVHVLDGWMPATKTHPARTIHEDGMWLP